MYCISVNYKNSDVNIRKKLAFPENVQKDFLTELINGKTVSECVILCTCNRTELYFCGNEDSLNTVQNLLSNYSGIECDLLKKHLYLFYSDKAVMHLFRVVSGIESMVIGEDEILGQIKLAYTMAKDLGMTGYELNMTFQSAMACAKKIKTQTALSKTSVSTATLAGNEIAHFKDKVNVLVIGATGKIGTVLVKNLLSHKNVSVIATSRKHSAESVQTKANITIANYADRYSYMDSADCVVSATASPHYTVTYYDLKKNIKTDKPRLFIDLAVPPDIDGSVAEIKGLKLIGIDYFEKLAKNNNELKLDSVESAKEIIKEESDVLKKDIAFHFFLPHMESVKDKLSENSLEEILYKFKAELPSEEFITEKFNKYSIPLESYIDYFSIDRILPILNNPEYSERLIAMLKDIKSKQIIKYGSEKTEDEVEKWIKQYVSLHQKKSKDNPEISKTLTILCEKGILDIEEICLLYTSDAADE